MTIGEKIQILRKEKGITQKKLGELAGIATITIQQYEAGKYEPKYNQRKKIATALGVTISDLMDIPGIIQQSQNILDDFGKHPENWVQENLSTGEAIPVKQARLLKHYDKLNELGKDKAIERIGELAEIKKYTEPKE